MPIFSNFSPFFTSFICKSHELVLAVCSNNNKASYLWPEHCFKLNLIANHRNDIYDSYKANTAGTLSFPELKTNIALRQVDRDRFLKPFLFTFQINQLNLWDVSFFFIFHSSCKVTVITLEIVPSFSQVRDIHICVGL